MSRTIAAATLAPMKSLRCSCGTLLDATNGEDLLAAVEAHIEDVHAPLRAPEPATGREAEPTSPPLDVAGVTPE